MEFFPKKRTAKEINKEIEKRDRAKKEETQSFDIEMKKLETFLDKQIKKLQKILDGYKNNLCRTCLFDFATCQGKDAVFGCDDGGLSTDDNVTKCSRYAPQNKGWECPSCGYDGADNRNIDTFCTKCHKHR